MDVVVLSLDECPRTPVLVLRDLLGGAELVTARSDAEIDEVLAARTGARLVVASATDGQLRAVVRRLVRRYVHRGASPRVLSPAGSPFSGPAGVSRHPDVSSTGAAGSGSGAAGSELPTAGSELAAAGPRPAAPGPRPAAPGSEPAAAGSGQAAAGSGPAAAGSRLAPDRTVADLPPIGILPLAPSGLVTQLGLPVDPDGVARAVRNGTVRRLDLLRTDNGSVTLDGALLGAADADGRAVRWHGRVEVDDALLSDGTDLLLACAIANGSGYSIVDGLPLTPRADPADGMIDVAVAIPRERQSRRWSRLRRGLRVEVEVRRARGRAVSITPRDGAVPLLDDGVAGTLDRRRSWWIERGAWGVYSS